MGTIAAILAGLALAGAATFGLVAAEGDKPAGPALPSQGVTYDAGK